MDFPTKLNLMILLIFINLSTFVTNFKLDQDIIVSVKMMMNQFLIRLCLQVIHNLCFNQVSKLFRDSRPKKTSNESLRLISQFENLPMSAICLFISLALSKWSWLISFASSLCSSTTSWKKWETKIKIIKWLF